MNKIRLFIIVLIVPVVMFSSSFANPSGGGIELSESEKYIFENRKNIKINKKDITRVKLKINSLKESVEGLKTVIESVNEKISSDIKSKSSSASSDEIVALKKKIEQNEAANKQRFKDLEKSIAKLIKLVSSGSSVKSTKLKLKKKTPKKVVKKLSSKESYNKGIKLLSKKKYSDARSYFLDSVEGNFRPATSYYNIAETLYFQRKFEEAIVYYKKSVDKDDKTSFLSTLMLHTGISFLKTKDKDGAKKFLNAVVAGYPNSRDAKIAKKYLKKL